MKRVFGAAVTAIFCLATPIVAGANCQSKLLDTAYDCQIAYEGKLYSYCIEFGHFGYSAYFDDADYSLAEYLACTCDDSGSATKPSFDSSSSQFNCTGISFPSDFLGTVSGKKVTGQGVYNDGSSAIYTCTKTTYPCS